MGHGGATSADRRVAGAKTIRLCVMTAAESSEHRGSAAAVDPRQVAAHLDEVVRQVDAGQIIATGPERAYLAGAAAALHVAEEPE